MSAPWPGEEARELYIRFLELELKVIRCASNETLDISLLGELSDLLKNNFPRTLAFIKGKSAEEATDLISSEISAIAWAEARAVADDTGCAHVSGSWTESEVADDINDCFQIALERLGNEGEA